MTVVFPLPLGPRKPKISPLWTRKLTSLTAVKLPKRRMRCSAEMAGSPFVCGAVSTASILRFQFHIRGHAGKDAAGGIIDTNFYANDLVNALFAGLHIARQEFSLLIDLLDDAIESSVRKRIDARFGGGDFLGTVAALQLIELMTRALLLGDGHFPVRFGGIALLLGDEVLFRERFVAVEIEVRAHFIGFRAV